MQTLNQLRNGELRGAVWLTLTDSGLSQFPEEIFDLADTLEFLDLSRNNLYALPSDFGRLHRLKIFFCSENLFTVLPGVLADCPLLDLVGFKANRINTVPAAALSPNLRWLILTDNQIEVLPPAIGNCYRLQKLMLAGNRLKALPEALGKCGNLELLRISANWLQTFPEWLLKMPKLSWLAFSGNPLCIRPVLTALDLINWRQLQIEHILGKGASGVIYQAGFQTDGGTRHVAVKIFKGAVTSDGYPEDEMNACVAAGNHDGLVRLIGQITGHPENKAGLVMELIDKRFFNLGLTPSYESCTRDVFAPELKLTLPQVIKIAKTIAAVAAHLHAKGIMHSDLYAHNILIDEHGNTLLSDFGAACFYDKTDEATAFALERLEVRAYGCLLEDLINLCADSENDSPLVKLEKLRKQCMDGDVMMRPAFESLALEMKTLAT